jgi:alkanesulfonate monooxygenase SsuD/methylene tetrahydromethanopterin reductase-like flavin-dependent oxidoreductase (luciferase family)
LNIGVSIFFPNQSDWPRFLAMERGEEVPPRPKKADHEVWAENLKSARLAEELEFSSLWTIEHRVAPYAMTPNPVQMLSYWAGALKQIDLGSMVIVLPWHHPLRVAEELVVLDNLLAGSGRKVSIGVGRGAARREFNALGIDMNESRQRFNESVEIIKLALTNDRFSYDGKLYHFHNVELRPQPRDGHAILDRLYCAAGSPSTVPIAAGYGLKPLIIPQRSYTQYVNELEEWSQSMIGAGYRPSRAKVSVWMYCAETEEDALEAARKHMTELGVSSVANYDLNSDHFKDIKGYEYYAGAATAFREAEARGSNLMAEGLLREHCWGTPEMCYQRIKEINEMLHTEEIVLQVHYGTMTPEQAEKSMRLFAKEVLPAARKLPTLEPLVRAAPDVTTQAAR